MIDPTKNGAQAIAFLRSNGVSVKAEVRSEFGTWWLVSGEAGRVDLATILLIAVRRGFAA